MEKTPDKIPLTIELPHDLARRLQAAAVERKREASMIVLELLDRHLPRAPDATKKLKIPYS
jgi:predicted transcriptional regulator